MCKLIKKSINGKERPGCVVSTNRPVPANLVNAKTMSEENTAVRKQLSAGPVTLFLLLQLTQWCRLSPIVAGCPQLSPFVLEPTEGAGVPLRDSNMDSELRREES